MSVKLTDAQLVMMSAAAQREDRGRNGARDDEGRSGQ